MIQLSLPSALDKRRKHDHKVVCMQRNKFGLYVGTLQQTEDGYTGYLLSPKHPHLPPSTSGRLGFLHSNRDEAFEALALHVAKSTWTNDPSFEVTCLDKCSRATLLAFEEWLKPNLTSRTAWPFNANGSINSTLGHFQASPTGSLNVNVHQSPGAAQ